jgi:hypothetical protein
MPPRKKSSSQRQPEPEQNQNEPEQTEPEQEQADPAEEEQVEVEFGDDPSETATLLLAAAEELHGDQSLVRTGNGVFYVPKSVADKAKE